MDLLVDCRSEKILKKLVGRTDVEDALSRLDMLTKEETSMMVMRNLEVTQHVESVVHDVDGNVKASKVLTEDIDGNVKATKVLIEDIDDNVKATKVLTEDIGDNVKATKVLTEDIDDNVKATKAHIHNVDKNIEATKVLVEVVDDNVRGIDSGTQRFLFDFMRVPTLFMTT